jgi:hypothetical protein
VAAAAAAAPIGSAELEREAGTASVPGSAGAGDAADGQGGVGATHRAWEMHDLRARVVSLQYTAKTAALVVSCNARRVCGDDR